MKKECFLLTFQYLGFRYFGVQKHPGLKTIQELIEKKVSDQFPACLVHTKFSSRTDKMVSSLESYCLLTLKGETLPDADHIKEMIQFPADVLILDCKKVPSDFRLLKSIVEKKYHYYFSVNINLPHVFSAPFMSHFKEKLDIELMKKGAELFVGTRELPNYVMKTETLKKRTISHCRISRNTDLCASFFPETSYVLEVQGTSFKRGQIRLMMGALVRLGKNEISLTDFEHSLNESDPGWVKFLAPPSGLMLVKSHLLPT